MITEILCEGYHDWAFWKGMIHRERLVCSAVLAQYPERGEIVSHFLSAEPKGELGPKQHAWSFMAKWFGDRGCEDFYSAIWEDPDIAKHLEALLTETGNQAKIASILA